MEPQQVDENLQRFGEIKSSYKSKKNASGRTLYMGVRVYNIILKKAIPRFLQIGGKQIRTKYTGEDQHLQQERDARLQEREKREVQRQQQQYIRENQHNDTDANVTTITNVNKPEMNTETVTDTVTEEITEDIRATLTDELLTPVLQTNTDSLQVNNETEEDTDATDYIVVKGKGKRKKMTKDSHNETTTKKIPTHKYKLDIDIITKMVEIGGMERLPTTAFDSEDYTHTSLLGLCYLLREGNLLRTDWYDEDCPPPSNLYDPDRYGYWKILSIFNASEIAEHISKWVNRFDGYFLHV